AEDGIRDLIVTGVQTCALPICLGGQLLRRVALLVPLPGKRRLPHHVSRASKGRVQFRPTPHVAALSTGASSRVFSKPAASRPTRSEERRVGKECRSRWGPHG